MMLRYKIQLVLKVSLSSPLTALYIKTIGTMMHECYCGMNRPLFGVTNNSSKTDGKSPISRGIMPGAMCAHGLMSGSYILLYRTMYPMSSHQTLNYEMSKMMVHVLASLQLTFKQFIMFLKDKLLNMRSYPNIYGFMAWVAPSGELSHFSRY